MKKILDGMQLVILALIVVLLIAQQINFKGKEIYNLETDSGIETIYFNKHDVTLTFEYEDFESGFTATREFNVSSVIDDKERVSYYFGGYILKYDKATKAYSITN